MSIEYRCPKKEFQLPTESLEIFNNAQFNKREYVSEAVKSEAKSQKTSAIVDKMQSGSFSISCIPGKSEPRETETAQKARYWP